MMKRYCCLFAFIVCFVPTSVFGLDPDRKLNQHTLEVYTTEAGLPQSSVVSIIQTADGYLWMGTFEGIARFDGRRFTIFDKTNVPELENNSIKALFQSTEGCLWAATPNGLLCMKNGKFVKYTTANGLASNFILSLTEDSDGHLWVGTTHGLSRFDGDAFQSFSEADGLIDEYVAALSPAPDNGVWVGTAEGLDLFRDGTFTHYGKADGLPGLDIRCLYTDTDGSLWIGTGGDGLAHYQDSTFQVYNKKQGLMTPDVRAIVRDRNGTLWIGTNGGGLYCIRANGIFCALSERDGLRNNAVRAVLEDQEGSIWIGTRDGLYQLKDDKYSILSSRNGLPVDSVRSVFQTSDGTRWVGTVGGGLVRYREGEVRTFNERDGFTSTYIWSMDEDDHGNLWVGTYGGGLVKINGNRVTRYGTEHGLSHDIVRVVKVTRDNRIWIGTNGGGVDVMENGRFIAHYSSENGLSEDFVYSIAEDKSGAIWIGTYSGGVNRINDGRITVFGSKAGFTNNGVWVIYPDQDGSLWIGTDDTGLFHYADNTFHRFTMKDGLINDSTFSLIEDREGNLWMNCNRGLFSVPKAHLLELESGQRQSVSCRTLGKSDGIKVTESNGPASPAAWMMQDGTLWFSTIKGVAIVDPDRKQLNHVPPPVSIESILINGTTVDIHEPIEVPVGPGEMEIHYTGLSFLLPEKVQFKYMLEGYNQDWVDAGSRRTAFYTNLAPRDYTFRVIASNNDGIWNEVGDQISMSLRPPFTRTPLFYGMCLVLFIVAVAVIYYLRIRQLRRRERELTALVDQRTLELHEVNQKLEYLARTDGLTDIPNHRYLMEQIEKEWRTAFRETRPISVLFIDIDRFKVFNDTHGHQEGDRCLRNIAQLLKSELKRPRDFIARYGGEEFVVILPETDRDGAMAMADRLRNTVETTCKLRDSEAKQHVTISVGVTSVVPVEQDNINALIRAADQALYDAKEGGRNRVVFQEIER